MKKLLYISNIVLMSLLISCGGGGDDDPPVVEPVEKDPTKATLVFPANNEECNTGSSLSATRSSVVFNWNAGTNTSRYTVYVKNLISNVEQNLSTTSTELSIVIDKATPYKWWVVSESSTSSVTAKSDEWKFYNSGDPVTSYAPFPADLVSPEMGSEQTGAVVTLEWDGSDIDEDISEYDVYFGTENPPVSFLETVAVEKIESVSVSSNVYFWKVITKDEEGNSSSSEIFQFKVN